MLPKKKWLPRQYPVSDFAVTHLATSEQYHRKHTDGCVKACNCPFRARGEVNLYTVIKRPRGDWLADAEPET